MPKTTKTKRKINIASLSPSRGCDGEGQRCCFCSDLGFPVNLENAWKKSKDWRSVNIMFHLITAGLASIGKKEDLKVEDIYDFAASHYTQIRVEELFPTTVFTHEAFYIRIKDYSSKYSGWVFDREKTSSKGALLYKIKENLSSVYETSVAFYETVRRHQPQSPSPSVDANTEPDQNTTQSETILTSNPTNNNNNNNNNNTFVSPHHVSQFHWSIITDVMGEKISALDCLQLLLGIVPNEVFANLLSLAPNCKLEREDDNELNILALIGLDPESNSEKDIERAIKFQSNPANPPPIPSVSFSVNFRLWINVVKVLGREEIAPEFLRVREPTKYANVPQFTEMDYNLRINRAITLAKMFWDTQRRRPGALTRQAMIRLMAQTLCTRNSKKVDRMERFFEAIQAALIAISALIPQSKTEAIAVSLLSSNK